MPRRIYGFCKYLIMQDWKQILKSIYTPDVCSLWAVPNKIWNNGFASNKAGEDLHPALVEKVTPCKTITHIIPGTSKDYKQGSCVFKIKINQKNPASVTSYFLIKLSMPFTKDALVSLRHGWDGVDILNEKQIEDFKMQLKFCRG
ncbi:MAG: hypothetical protein JST10_02270 [Bacteroidetes bacterium]|nr:hypothetical protein [Bacteroidota bacterium]